MIDSAAHRSEVPRSPISCKYLDDRRLLTNRCELSPATLGRGLIRTCSLAVLT